MLNTEMVNNAEQMLKDLLFDPIERTSGHDSLILVIADVFEYLVDEIKNNTEKDQGMDSETFIQCVVIGLQNYIDLLKKNTLM